MRSKCFHCKKEYTKNNSKGGCPKCAKGIIIAEVEFRKPLNQKAKVNELNQL